MHLTSGETGCKTIPLHQCLTSWKCFLSKSLLVSCTVSSVPRPRETGEAGEASGSFTWSESRRRDRGKKKAQGSGWPFLQQEGAIIAVRNDWATMQRKKEMWRGRLAAGMALATRDEAAGRAGSPSAAPGAGVRGWSPWHAKDGLWQTPPPRLVGDPKEQILESQCDEYKPALE